MKTRSDFSSYLKKNHYDFAESSILTCLIRIGIPDDVSLINCSAIVFSFLVQISFYSYCPVYRALVFKGLTSENFETVPHVNRKIINDEEHISQGIFTKIYR